jgi:hypothetical protein
MVLCDECDTDGTSRCGSCQTCRYCSKECQKKAWPAHKLLCKTVKDFQVRPESDQKSEKYTRAIYFHPEEGAPRFVWLKTERIDEDECSDAALLPRFGALAANNNRKEKSGDYTCMSDF